MKKSEAINYFGGPGNLARKIGISQHAIYQWPENNVPARSQWAIAASSSFALMPDEKLLPNGVTPEKLKSGASVASEQVQELLITANELAEKGKGDILEALITMAKHNL